MFGLEQPSIVYDLTSHQKTKIDQVWSHAKKFIEEDVGTAVDDHRHSTVVHVVKAISVHDLRKKVVERCPLTHLCCHMSGFVFSILQCA